MGQEVDIISWNCAKTKSAIDQVNSLIVHRLIHDHQEVMHTSTNPLTSKILLLQEVPPYSELTLKKNNWKLHILDDTRQDFRSAVLFYPNCTETTSILEDKDIIAVDTKINQQKIRIISVYIPHKASITNYLAKITTLLCEPNCEYIIGGDFNARSTLWGDKLQNKRGKQLKNWIDESNLVITNNVDSSTFSVLRRNRLYESSIDLILTSPALMIGLSHVDASRTLMLSDHRPIAIKLKNCRLEVVSNYTTRKYRKKQSSYENFSKELDRQLSMLVDSNRIGSLEASDLERKFHNSACGNLVPVDTRPKKPDLPWFDKEIEAITGSIRKVKKFEKKGSINSQISKRRLIEKMKIHLTKMIQIKKKAYFKELMTVNQPEMVWDAFYKRLIRKYQDTDIYIKDGQTRIVDTYSILELLAKRFFPADLRDNETDIHKEIRIASESEYIYEEPNNEITREEVNLAIDSFACGKCPGKDGITNEIIQAIGESSRKALHKFFNQKWKKGEFPNCWKVATIKFIPKPGTAKGTLKQFRPIGLLPCLSKVYERILADRIEWSRRKNLNKDIRNKQYGFTQGKSAEDALFDMIDWIKEKHALGKKVILVSLDIESAFDRAWWPLILYRLKGIKVDKFTFNVMKEYMSQRSVDLVLKDKVLKTKQSVGCVQGSVLGPLLWNLIVDELLERTFPPGVRCQAYADDLALLSSGKTYEEAERAMQISLKQVENWADKGKLKVSAEKTHMMLFRSQKRSRKVNLILNDKKLQEVNEIRLLGYYIDKYLTGVPHIKRQCAKVNAMFSRFAPFIRKMSGPSQECMRLIIEGAVIPKLTYCSSIVEQNLSKVTVMKMLKKVHRQWLIRAYKMFPTTSYLKVLAASSSRSIDEIVRVRARLYKVKRNPIIRETLFEARVIDVRKVSLDIPPWTKECIKAIIEDGVDVNIGESFSIFTDGSKIDNGVGAAMVVYNQTNQIVYSKKIKLACESSVFQAEILALYEALLYVEKIAKEADVVKLCSDSRSGIEAIIGFNKTFDLVWKTRKLAWKLKARNIGVNLVWVKAHVGIPQNEYADQLAKAAATDDTLAEVHCYTPYSSEKRRIEGESEFRLNRLIKSAYPELFAKIGTSLWNKTIYNVSLSEHFIMIITGHGPFKSNLHQIKCVDTDICRCDLGVQNAQHIFECPLLWDIFRTHGQAYDILKRRADMLKGYLASKPDVDKLLDKCFRRLLQINSNN